jgi:hypothetical protein
MWGLWRYIYRAPVDKPRIFCVTLQKNERVNSVRFEDNSEVPPKIMAASKVKELRKTEKVPKPLEATSTEESQGKGAP